MGWKDKVHWASVVILTFPATGLQLLIYYELKRLSAAGMVRRANMRHQAKFHADRSNRCGDIAAFQFFKMKVSAIWDF